MANANAAGYILKLDENRYTSLRWNIYDKFTQPVPEFKHSSNRPLVCFIINHNETITHIGSGSRGQFAGTDLRKLNIEEIFELSSPVNAREIAHQINPGIRHYLIEKIEEKGISGLLGNKTFEEFLEIFLKEAPETKPILDKFSKSRNARIKNLSAPTKKALAEQKEAMLTALNIAGIDRSVTQGWDYEEKEKPTSFLSGLPQVRLREDQLLAHDLSTFPEFEVIENIPYAATTFKNEYTHLTVVLANRHPLEEQTGTDLIYFNEDFECFIMVQYKIMEQEGNTFRFRLPNTQLQKEIERMDKLYKKIKPLERKEHIDDYRISETPFFIKICPRIEFDPDNSGLTKGMYIPLDYIKKLETDKCIEGKNGGKGITYDNIRRYFDNTAFKTIVEGGWIGTNQKQSTYLKEIIRNSLTGKKAVVIARKKQITPKKGYRR